MHEFVHLPSYSAGNSTSRLTPLGTMYVDQARYSSSSNPFDTDVVIPAGTLANTGDFLMIQLAGQLGIDATDSSIEFAALSSWRLLLGFYSIAAPGTRYMATVIIANNGSPCARGALVLDGYSPKIRNQDDSISMTYTADWTLRVRRNKVTDVNPFGPQEQNFLSVFVGKKP